jgi:hypothetical protein
MALPSRTNALVERLDPRDVISKTEIIFPALPNPRKLKDDPIIPSSIIDIAPPSLPFANAEKLEPRRPTLRKLKELPNCA